MIIPQWLFTIWFGLSALSNAYYIGVTGKSETKVHETKQSEYKLALILNSIFIVVSSQI